MLRVALMLMAALTFRQGVEQWRADYEAGLKAPDGWLAVAGLFWLHEGDNIVGSDPQSDIVLPAGSPKRAGVFNLKAGVATWVAAGTPGKVLKSDSSEEIKIGAISLGIIARGGKTGVRMRDPNSEAVRTFKGCLWYPIDEKWHVFAKWTPYPQPKKIPITNILGMIELNDAPGYAEFTLLGQKIRLEPVIEKKQLFFMFKDKTTGTSTYGAGRFLYASGPPKDGKVELDFNIARNPPCVYTAYATCPLPPKQNTMPIALEAGEKINGHH
jgi:uncharacterized protein (DUF1684 family)